MPIVPANQVYRAQLVKLRGDLVSARLDLARGLPLAHGFDTEVTQVLLLAEGLQLRCGKVCGEYARSILGRPAEVWVLDDIDRIIDRVEDATLELTPARGPGSAT